MNLRGRLAVLEKLRAALKPKPEYRIFRQSLADAGTFYEGTESVFDYPDGVLLPPGSLPERAYSRAEIAALTAAGERCICIEYAERWPPGGE